MKLSTQGWHLKGARPRRTHNTATSAIRLTLLGLLLTLTLADTAAAAQPPVGLGTATSFAVLGGSTVTNTGPTVVNGDLGVSPGTAVTGFPPGTLNGTLHAADAVAAQAQSDTTTAYNDAAGRTPAVNLPADLGGLVLAPGVFKASSSLGLTGDVTLDAQGNPSAVFVFQVGSTLTTASASRVVLTNGANACNVYWQIGSSATLGTNSSFTGTLLALTSITLNTGAAIHGRALARNGAVTMDDNAIARGTCATTPAGSGGSGLPSAGAPGAGLPGTSGTGSTGAPRAGTAVLTSAPPRRSDRCTGGFRATVTGLMIRRVVFSLDARRVATLVRSPFAVSVPRLAGMHLLRAQVTFRDSTRPVSLRLRYRACTSARRRVPANPIPRFTG